MKKKIAQFLIAVLLFTIGFSFPNNVKAASVSDIYNNGIRVRLSTFESGSSGISSIAFSLSNSYMLKETGYILQSGSSYTVSESGGALVLYKNGQAVGTFITDITITPLNIQSSVTLGSDNYQGTIKFHMLNSTAFYIINSIGFEDYVKGVLPYEMSESWPIEALKAQAVAARTFGLKHVGQGTYDVTNSTSSQVYHGYNSANKNCIQAVDSTRGQVLTYSGSLIDALYSASNGGYTEDSKNVWGGSYPYLISKEDPYDNNNSVYKNKWPFGKRIFTNGYLNTVLHNTGYLGPSNTFTSIDKNSIHRYVSGRVSTFNIIYDGNQTLTMSGKIFSSLFGFDSNLWYFDYDNISTYTFYGYGYGHGVGMSQWGAYYRAKGGLKYADILKFYYPGTLISTLSSRTNINKFTGYIGGADRYKTSIQVAAAAFNASPNNKLTNVVIATGNDFPDALSGASLAKKLNAPILLVGSSVSDTGSQEVLNYINSNMNKNGTVYILGLSGAVSSNFEPTLASLGFSHIKRLGGKGRIETSLAINTQLAAPAGTPIVIATSANFPDALSISPVAAKNGWPVLLTDSASMSQGLEDYLSKNKPSAIYIAGGTGVVSQGVYDRIAALTGYDSKKIIRLSGIDRYATSRVINSYFYSSTNNVALATGQTFPDALSGSVYAAVNNMPIMLADSNNASDAASYTRLVYSNTSVQINLFAFGLSGAVDSGTVSSLSSITN